MVARRAADVPEADLRVVAAAQQVAGAEGRPGEAVALGLVADELEVWVAHAVGCLGV